MWLEITLSTAAGAAAGFGLCLALQKRRLSSGLLAMRRDGEEALRAARDEAERLVKEARIQARDEQVTRREEVEREAEEAMRELRESEKRVAKREESLAEKEEAVARRDRLLADHERTLAGRQAALQEREGEADRREAEVSTRLLEVAGLTKEAAASRVLERVEGELGPECARLVETRVRAAEEEAETRARDVVLTAMQRLATTVCSSSVVSTVDVPNDEMKGRIIGREGRNIRAFENATGVDVIVDDTPGVIVVSAFDGVRREIARRAMVLLVQDGRVHPSRIEEVVAQVKREMETHLRETGKKALLEVGLHGLHGKLIELLGRLKFRTSYGQNVLDHLIEAAHLGGAMAAEMGLDVKTAKRATLLHDIGKAVDHETEGGHPAIGADLARRCGEHRIVVNAIASHHDDVPKESVYAVLCQLADSVSASRPGARRETFERYIERLQRLEEVATSFPGVEQAYAIQAGREVRVIVNNAKVSDRLALKVARDIASEIERELTYPGEVRVTLVRETRVVEYAR